MTSPTNHPTIIIAGGSGFLGRSLARHLATRGNRIVILSRSAPREAGPWTHISWDGRTCTDWAAHLSNAAAIVNLAGRTVDCIKSPDHCDQILRSRVESTRALGLAVRAINNPPPVWVQMSTTHIYGDPPTDICDESSALGYGLAPTVGAAWEAAFHESALPHQRPVILRTSFVIGRGGGALKRLALLTRFGLGGTVGSGSQGMSWIHEHDMNRIFERAIVDPTMRATYIATAPEPVSNREFMRELRHAMRIPIGLPAAAWMVRIGAPLLLRTDPELALYGRYCIPQRLLAEGFTFEFSSLPQALRDLAGPAGNITHRPSAA